MEEIKHAIQDEYPDNFAKCYGCGRLNKDGLHVRTGWEGDNTVSYYTPRENEIAVEGVVYGGLIASIIDCHGIGSAALAFHRKNGHEPGDGVDAPRFVTASLHIDYLKPTPHGVTLKLVSEVEEVHPKRFIAHTELIADGEICAKGEVVAAMMPESFLEMGK